MTCGHSRYKTKTGMGKTLVAYKKLRYFPITPRLQMLFMSYKIWEWIFLPQRRTRAALISNLGAAFLLWLAFFPLSFGQFSGSASRCDLQRVVSSSFTAGDDLFWFGWCCCCSLFCSSQSYFSSAAVSLCLMPLLASSMLVVTFIMLAIFKDFALLDLLEGCAPSLLVLCLCMFNAEVPLMPTLM